MFIECAIACEADYLITGDRDFEGAHQVMKTKILSVVAVQRDCREKNKLIQHPPPAPPIKGGEQVSETHYIPSPSLPLSVSLCLCGHPSFVPISVHSWFQPGKSGAAAAGYRPPQTKWTFSKVRKRPRLQATRDSNPQPSVLETDALPIELVACVRSTDTRCG